jgi:hypothetical protein
MWTFWWESPVSEDVLTASKVEKVKTESKVKFENNEEDRTGFRFL